MNIAAAMTIAAGQCALMAWVVLASVAQAEMPPFMCEGSDAHGTSQALRDYNYWPAGDGFVAYTAYDDATSALVDVLEHCADRRQLLLRTGTSATDAAVDAAAIAMMDEMIRGATPYTMDAMAERLRALGAPVEIRIANYQSCACANQ